MRLADFIRGETAEIIGEWEEFAATRLPAAGRMTRLALRDHAREILIAIATDLDTPQSAAEQTAKSRGEAGGVAESPATAAQTHGLLRANSGFNVSQMVSEYRALRASVLRLWIRAWALQEPDLEDMIRFNEAVDQAVAESVAFYSQRVDQSRDLFLGMLGHDMRTPLQAIRMTAIHLARLNAGETVTDAASRLERSGMRMQTMLDDLVEFNRINLGLGLPIDRQPADLGELFSDQIAEIQSAHPTRTVQLAVRGSADGLWDRVCVQRLLSNLVVNALKYGSPNAPVRVIVNGESDLVVIEVHNEGVPIESSIMASLFDPLKRGGQHQGHAKEGSLGLGLYIAREVAHAHGGEIEATSDANETVFTARLPKSAAT